MIRATFADGGTYVAPTWAALEDCLKADEWNPDEHLAYRKEFTLRAVNWTGWQLNKDSSARTFLRGLERAGILALDIVEIEQ